MKSKQDSFTLLYLKVNDEKNFLILSLCIDFLDTLAVTIFFSR